MIDKVLLNIRTLPLLYFVALAAGCVAEIPLKQPAPNGAAIAATTPIAQQESIQCHNGVNGRPKKVAILHIGMAQPAESRLFPHLQELFTKRLLQRAQLESPQHLHDATQLTLDPGELTLMGRVNPDLSSQLREIGRQTDSQIIVQGTISKVEVYEPGSIFNNISTAIERVSEYLAAISWRKVSIKQQIFDSYSGKLLSETETKQKISLKSGEPLFLMANMVDQKKYEAQMIEAIDALINKQLAIVDEVASCTPLKGRVIAADNMSATINVGAHSQVSAGDRLDLIQSRLVHTDSNGIEQITAERVGTLTITSVLPDSATGRLEGLSRATEIHLGDMVVTRPQQM